MRQVVAVASPNGSGLHVCVQEPPAAGGAEAGAASEGGEESAASEEVAGAMADGLSEAGPLKAAAEEPDHAPQQVGIMPPGSGFRRNPTQHEGHVVTCGGPCGALMGRPRVLHAVVGLLLVCSAAHSCVVVELSDAGLAANVNSLWGSLPAYHGFNGTIYLDSWKFAYKCAETGGFGDFFKPDEGGSLLPMRKVAV